MQQIKYPKITVTLTGKDGNAYAILGAVQNALLDGGVAQGEVDEFHREATSGDYDELLRTAMRWVDVR